MDGISKEMTVKEALEHCAPGERVNLTHWAESFAVRVCDFHIGHIETYTTKRKREADWQVVNCEVDALLRLLDSVGSGGEIRNCYRPLREPDELSREERETLPTRVRKYIQKLESELQSLAHEKDHIAGRLQKANWAKWRG